MKDPPPIPELVERLGSPTAAVHVQPYDPHRRQRKRQGHYHDDRYRVRMPCKDFPRMFPHASADIVSKAIGQLEDEGLLRTVHYDDLSSYAISRKPSACRP